MRRSGSKVVLAALAAAAALGLPGAAMAATGPPGSQAHGKTASGSAPRAAAAARSARITIVTEQGRAAASAASGLPLPPLCKQAKKSTRTAQCRVGPGKFILVSGAGVVLGTGDFNFANWEFLDAKSRTWHNTVEMEVTHLSGVAAIDPLESEFGLLCSAGCTVTSQNPGPKMPVLRDVVFQHTFTVDSPGKATVDATQVPRVLFVDLLPPVTIPGIAQGEPITARCDSERFPTNPPPGCVNASFTPTFTLSHGDGVDDIVKHIGRAQTRLHNHWGRKGSGPPLHRTTDAALIDANRAVACGNRGKPPHPDQNCDEYPFASTEEGAANNPHDFSWAWVNAGQNARAGGLLGAFYAKNRVISKDAFWVSVS